MEFTFKNPNPGKFYLKFKKFVAIVFFFIKRLIFSLYVIQNESQCKNVCFDVYAYECNIIFCLIPCNKYNHWLQANED